MSILADLEVIENKLFFSPNHFNDEKTVENNGLLLQKSELDYIAVLF